MISIAAINRDEAREYFEKHSAYREAFDFAIAARDEMNATHGVIALCANGDEFKLGHISTDGNAQVGSLLYGAAWRVAKAMGYKTITI